MSFELELELGFFELVPEQELVFFELEPELFFFQARAGARFFLSWRWSWSLFFELEPEPEPGFF